MLSASIAFVIAVCFMFGIATMNIANADTDTHAEKVAKLKMYVENSEKFIESEEKNPTGKDASIISELKGVLESAKALMNEESDLPPSEGLLLSHIEDIEELAEELGFDPSNAPAVEPAPGPGGADPGAVPGEEENKKPEQKKDVAGEKAAVKKNNNPMTADTNALGLYIALALSSGVATIVLRRKLQSN